MADEPDHGQQDVVRALGDSALAGGIVGLAIAAAAFLAARLLPRRLRKR